MQWFRRRLDWERETWEQGSSQKGRRRSTTDQGMRSTTDQGRMRSRDQGRIGMEKGTRSARWAGEEERRSQTCLTPVRFPNPLATGHSWQLGNLTSHPPKSCMDICWGEGGSSSLHYRVLNFFAQAWRSRRDGGGWHPGASRWWSDDHCSNSLKVMVS